MDYKKTAGYRSGVVCTAIGVLIFVVYAVQTFGPDLGLQSFDNWGLGLGFILFGVILKNKAKRRAEKEEGVDQENSDS